MSENNFRASLLLDTSDMTAVNTLMSRHGVETMCSIVTSYLDTELMNCSPMPIASYTNAPREGGLYALFQFDGLVYIGSANCLRDRLSQHSKSIRHATRLDVDQFFYKYIACGSMAASSEKQLIKHYQPAWNSTGFGSKAKGSGRCFQRKSRWDEMFGRA